MISAARTTKPAKKAQLNGLAQLVPPLQNGDQMTQKEFHRRYLAMPKGIKAELIDGVVYMASPVRYENHGEPHWNLACWSGFYGAHTPGVKGGDNATLLGLRGEQEPQPDLCLRIEEEFGGQSRVDDEGYLAGGPEWIGEISSSTVSLDLNKKFDVYQENGVLEYVVWRVDDEEIDWFILKRGKYQRLAKTKDGLYKSKVFPGLWLDPTAIIKGDMIKVLDIVKQGIASPEHRRFVEKLRAKKK
jgi:Uma2 family endonuclease